MEHYRYPPRLLGLGHPGESGDSLGKRRKASLPKLSNALEDSQSALRALLDKRSGLFKGKQSDEERDEGSDDDEEEIPPEGY